MNERDNALTAAVIIEDDKDDVYIPAAIEYIIRYVMRSPIFAIHARDHCHFQVQIRKETLLLWDCSTYVCYVSRKGNPLWSYDI